MAIAKAQLLVGKEADPDVLAGAATLLAFHPSEWKERIAEEREMAQELGERRQRLRRRLKGMAAVEPFLSPKTKRPTGHVEA